MCYLSDMHGARRRMGPAIVLALALATACGSSSPGNTSTAPAAGDDARLATPMQPPPASRPTPAATQTSAPEPLSRPGCALDVSDCPDDEDDGQASATSGAQEPSATASEDAEAGADDAVAPTTGQVTVHLSGFRNHTGKALLALFTSKKGYPEKGKLAFKRAAAPIRHNAAKVVFRDVPAGEFAVVVLHDENGNKKMDKNFLGMPQEGWGVSRNPKTRMRPPNWGESALRLDAGASVRVDIKMKYL